MKIIICGDIVPTNINKDDFVANNLKKLFADVPDIFKGAAAVIANLECPLTECEMPIKKLGPNLKAPKECVKTLKNAGITHCTLSNNHIYDYGMLGLTETLSSLEAEKIIWTGVGKNELDARKNMTIEADGKKIVVVNVCEHEYSFALPDRAGARAYDPYDTMRDIREAKKTADYVFVIYHGGKEFCEYPSPRLRKLCRSMVYNGADLVTCQHSHCIGCAEEYSGSYILYGQGNFHFVAKQEDPMWNCGLVLDVEIRGDKPNIKLIPVVTGNGGIRIAGKYDSERILSAMDKRNTGDWAYGWNNYCEANRAAYTEKIARHYTENASEEDNQYFASRLTCEAHTDVWRELFKTWNCTNK